MVGEKIKYACKKCGWQTSIRVEWSDLKPKRCMNKKCNASFRKDPDLLQIEMPISKDKKVLKKSSKKSVRKKTIRSTKKTK